jgi:nucleoside-diphosphate-sugar epimerase
MARGDETQIFGDGHQTRDFVYVGDVVEAMLAAAGHDGGVYNVGTGVETSIRELAEMIVRLAGSSSEIELGLPRDWDRSGHRFGSTEKAKRELGFEAAVPLEEGLRRTIDWMRANVELIDACIERHAAQMERVPA